MGKAFAIVGLVLLALVGGCLGCLYLAYKEGSSTQEEFYALLASGDSAKVHGALHPALAEKIDEPVLAVWMEAVTERLGAFKEMDKTKISFTTKDTDKGKLFEYRGVAKFEKGEAESMVQTLDGKYSAFNVESDLLKDWFTGVKDTTVYQARGKAFLDAILATKPTVSWDMMHPNLQEKLDQAKWSEQVADLSAHYKKGVATFARDEGAVKVPPEIALVYTLPEGGKEAMVRFQYADLKYHLVGFNVPK